MLENNAGKDDTKKHDPLDDLKTDHLSFRERNEYFNARNGGNPSGAKTILAMATARAYDQHKIATQEGLAIFEATGISLQKARDMSRNTTI